MGFRGVVRRLGYFYGSSFSHTPVTKLFTLQANGVVEGKPRSLQPNATKGLLSYPFLQRATNETRVRKWLGTPWVFIHSDKLMVQQVWATNYNDKFKEAFSVSDSPPETGAWDPDAAESFANSMKKVFGPSAEKLNVKYCTKLTDNPEMVVRGTQHQILRLLAIDAEILRYFQIIRVSKKDAHTTTVTVSQMRNGKYGRYDFHLNSEDSTEYVMYFKTGCTSMTSFKTWQQFCIDNVVEPQQIEHSLSVGCSNHEAQK